jgi:hypothetical protein
MLCVRCGQTIEAGKSFCGNCGAAAPLVSETGASGAGDPSVTAVRTRSQTTPPPADFTQGSPSAAEGGGGGYGTGWQPPRGPVGGGRRTGLIAVSVAVGIIVFAGLGVGLWLGLRDGGTDKTAGMLVASGTTSLTGTSIGGSLTADAGAATTVAAATTASVAAATTTLAAATTTVAAATTTLAATTTTRHPATTTTESPGLAEYLIATDALVSQLENDDAAIPGIEDEIILYGTTPGGTAIQQDRLMVMQDALNSAILAVSRRPVPAGYEEADSWLLQAAGHMGTRIAAELSALEAILFGGTVDAGTPSFGQARDAMNACYDAMERYAGALPAR